MRRYLFLFLLALTAGGFAKAADLPPVKSVIPCEALAKQDLAAAVGAPVKIGKVSTIGAFCRVEGTIAPEIAFEVNLPVEGWQQRYLQTGCGGLCGMLSTHLEHAGTCAPAQQAGLVVASDDMGHHGMSPDFGADPQKRIDFAYRGNHLTALAAKALIKAFYGQAPKYSYFAGCSDGGREALVEAQRYPDDFNGITAGAPALNFQVQNSFYHAWQTVSNTGPDGKAILVADRLPILHKAVLAACGDADGLVADPRACHFDPAAAQCKAGEKDTSACLSEAEVTVARRFYQGPVDAAGHHFTIGGPQYGSELSWAGVYVPRSPDEPIFSKMIASGSSQFVIFPEVSAAEGDVAHFAFTQAHFAQLKALHPLYDGGDTDLGRFDKAGGKLILWHGWSDPHISPINTIAYYQGVAAKLGKDETNAFARLFLFPGLYHCGGGDGYSQFDMLSAIIDWVENKKAPDSIAAAQVAQLDHKGPPPGMGPRANPPPLPDPDQQALKTRAIKAYALEDKLPAYDWEGADLIGPDFQKVYAVKDGKLVAQ